MVNFRASSLIKSPANVLTVSRMLLSFPLVWIAPLSSAFYVFYTLAGVTDMLDGPVARRTGTMSREGAMLDSIADVVFLAAALVALFPMLKERCPDWGLWPILVAAALRCGAYGVGLYKYRRFTPYHTRINKLTGAALFCAPYLLPFWQNTEVLWVVLCTVACISAGEELLMQLLSRRYDPDTQSVFDLKRRGFYV
ncbi:CDP-alcohol phosphatidyltransferase family protein [Oscillibacter sp.]|uniref:CDP-alcohol phosphatidyltransferase family protein n=1 Tax=Oscillibacter sp. TaxID=1945593 RepID=UPI0028AE4966|nr:CDP-alcohol phosphatidyltransferase family protein [Oscillibacter sp.]